MEIITINTESCVVDNKKNSLLDGRRSIAKMEQNFANAKVSITVLAYNRLEKTKRCIDSLLKYTKNIDYELILIDNGSTDDTFEYFKSLKFDKKRSYILQKILVVFFPWNVLA